MARFDLTIRQVIAQTGLHEQTVKAILAGNSKPHPRTLKRLATGLGVSEDELFQDPSLLVHRLFDRQTNPAVGQVVENHPALFAGWTESDFDNLYSRFGLGGQLTEEGVIEVVRAMERNRRVHQRVALILETGEAELLIGLVDQIFQRVDVEDCGVDDCEGNDLG